MIYIIVVGFVGPRKGQLVWTRANVQRIWSGNISVNSLTVVGLAQASRLLAAVPRFQSKFHAARSQRVSSALRRALKKVLRPARPRFGHRGSRPEWCPSPLLFSSLRGCRANPQSHALCPGRNQSSPMLRRLPPKNNGMASSAILSSAPLHTAHGTVEQRLLTVHVS